MKYREHICQGRFDVDGLNKLLAFIEEGGQLHQAEWGEVFRTAYNTAAFFYSSIPHKHINELISSSLEPDKIDMNYLKSIVKAHLNSSELGGIESLNMLREIHCAASFYYNQVAAITRAARMGGMKGHRQGSGK